jgi:hypothetical protein
MRKTLFVLLAAVLLVSATFAEDGFKFKITPMWMGVFGYNEHVGDAYTYAETYYGDDENYGATYDPLILDIPGNFGVRAGVSFMSNDWGIGASGWCFKTTGSLSGTVESTPYNITGVRMWGSTIIPVVDTSDASGLAPVDYYADNYLGAITGELFLIRTLTESECGEINISLGAKAGYLSNRMNKGLAMHAWTPWYSDSEGDHYWDNYITLDETSSVDYGFMIGPVAGLSGITKAGILYAEGSLNQSVLLGSAKFSGQWVDIDDIYDTVPSDASVPFETWTGTFTLSEERFVAIPVTELSAEAGFNIADLVRFSIGGFCSVWWNVPVAPTWNIHGDWTWTSGTGWILPYRTLVFAGAALTVTVHF